MEQQADLQKKASSLIVSYFEQVLNKLGKKEGKVWKLELKVDLAKRAFIESDNLYKGIKLVDPYQQLFRNMIEMEDKM